MSESDFYTVNSRYKAQDAASEWPVWELRGHGSAAPAPEPAAPDDPAGTPGPGDAPRRPDPLGPWFSARLTFADGARIDVLVTVADDGHITVEDMRADPPLTLDGLAALARWIEGPLDDACRMVMGRPRKDRPSPGREQDAVDPTKTAGLKPGAWPDSVPVPGLAGDVEAQTATDAVRAVVTNAVTGAAGDTDAEPVSPRMGDEEPASGRSADEDVAVPAGGVAHGDGVLCGEAARPAEPQSEHAVAVEGCAHAPDPSTTEGPSTDSAASPERDAASPESPPPENSVASPDGSAEPPAPSPSAVLARLRAGERRKFAADVYREAQREGRDPVLAVMNATGRNRRRSLRLIAGARDDGLLTPRHNKR
ncbi:DUF6214 family protein [Streptomyces halobius]|uniref:DUF6214 family protein n=1 Tax=Streptomyces halobius TaxID=2879846 RepID=UPI003872CCAD